MSKVISLDKYREMRYNRDILAIQQEADKQIQRALEKGMCPECGEVEGRHKENCGND